MNEQNFEVNAFNVREEHAGILIKQYLDQIGFPFNLIKVTVNFSFVLVDHAKHRIDINQTQKGYEGSVLLTLNAMFLFQDPYVFYHECIPHEIAHVVAKVDACKTQQDIAEHGIEWQEALAMLSESSIPSTSFVDSKFDSKAIILNKGGILCRCECDGDEAYTAFTNNATNTTKIKNEEMVCSICQCAYQPISLPDFPAFINTQLAFVKDEICQRASRNK